MEVNELHMDGTREGKVFALCPLVDDPLRLSLKCDPVIAEQLRATHAAITAGYHLNKRHWNTVTLDGSVPDRLVLEMGELTVARWGVARVVHRQKANAATPAAREIVEALAKECDVVFAGSAD